MGIRIPTTFIDNKNKALKVIKSSVKTILMVSGRAGIALINYLYDHGLTPASTIAIVIVMCETEEKKEQYELELKNYKVSKEFIVYK